MRILRPLLHLDHLAIAMVLVLQIRLLHHKPRLRWVTRIPAVTITAEQKDTAVAIASHDLTNLHLLRSQFMQEVLPTDQDSVITASRVVTYAHSLPESALVVRKMKLVLQPLSSFSAAVSELQERDRSLFHLMFPRFHLCLRVTKAKPSFPAAR
jgi:hypothetical protein